MRHGKKRVNDDRQFTIDNSQLTIYTQAFTLNN